MSTTIADLLVNFRGDIGDLASKIAAAKTDMNTVAESAKSSGGGILSGFKSGISGVLDFGAKIGQTVIGMQGLAQGAVGLASALLEPNASMEQTSTAFTQLLGSSKAASAELKDLQQFAASTPFEFPELADSTQKLLAFQIPLKDTKPLLTAIGDALSGLGKNTAASLDQVVNVFGQMNAAGKIQTQDLMQLTSVGINGFQILADQMHKPVSVIKDMVTSGVIPAQKGIEMLRAGMEKTFGGGMQAQSMTFNGLLSTFQDNIGAAWRTMSGPLFNSAKSALTEAGNLVSSPAFQDFATGTGQAIAHVFSQIGNFVSTNVVPAVHEFVGVIQSPQLAAFLIQLRDLGTQLVGMVAPAFKDSSVSAGSLFTFIKTTGLPALTGLVGGLTQTIKFLKDNGDAVKITAAAITVLFVPALIKSGVESTIASVKMTGQYIQGIIKTGIAGWEAAGKVATFIGSMIASGTQSVIAGAQIAASFVANMVKTGVEAAAAGVKIGVAFVANVAKAGIQAVVSGAQMLASLVPAIISVVAEATIAAVTAIPALVVGFGAWAAGAIAAAIPTLALTWPILAVAAAVVAVILIFKNWGAISTWVGGVFDWLGTHLREVATNIKNGVGDKFNELGTNIRNKATEIKNDVGQKFSDLGTNVHDKTTEMGVNVLNTWNKLNHSTDSSWQDIANTAGKRIGQMKDSVIASVGQMVANVVAWLINLKNQAGQKASDIVAAIRNFFTNLPGEAMQWGRNIIQGLINGIGSMLGNLSNMAGQAAQTIANFLPHSPAKEGPLRELNVFGPSLVKGVASGIDTSAPMLRASMLHLVQPMAYPIRPSAGMIASSVQASGSGGSSAGGQGQTFILEVDGMMLAKINNKNTDKLVRLKLGSKGRVA